MSKSWLIFNGFSFPICELYTPPSCINDEIEFVVEDVDALPLFSGSEEYSLPPLAVVESRLPPIRISSSSLEESATFENWARMFTISWESFSSEEPGDMEMARDTISASPPRERRPVVLATTSLLRTRRCSIIVTTHIFCARRCRCCRLTLDRALGAVAVPLLG